MLQKFALGKMPAYEPEYARLLASLQQDIEGRSDAGTRIPLYRRRRISPAALLPTFWLQLTVRWSSRKPGLCPSAPAPVVEMVIEQRQENCTPHLLKLPPIRHSPNLFSHTRMTPRPIRRWCSRMNWTLIFAGIPRRGPDMLPQMGSVLRSWQEQPANAGSAAVAVALCCIH